MTFPATFLWGASTAPHQVEGDNTDSGWWLSEQLVPGLERSGDAVDGYHRYPEDRRLLAEAGLNAYRFGVVGIDVRGYLRWSALDNFEWGSWEPTFGLIAVDRETFERHPKPSLPWLGHVARHGLL